MATLADVQRSQARDSGKMPGYKQSICVKPVEEKFICPRCQGILRNPVQTGCGERFCKHCAEEIMSQDIPRCPVCKEVLNSSEVYRDAFAGREVLALDVTCENTKAGCKWTGILREYDEHLTECDFRDYACPHSHMGCAVHLPRQLLDQHVREDCPYRMLPCELCGDLVAKTLIAHHRSHDCKNRHIQCLQCGAARIPKSKMDQHLGEDCPRQIVSCELFDLGCKDTFYREDEEEHNTVKMKRHFQLMSRASIAASKVKEELAELRVKVCDQEKEILELKAAQGISSMHQAASQSHGHVTRLPERRLLAHTSTESNDYPDSVPSSVWSSRATQSSITTDGMASSRHTTDTRSSASASTAIAISGATEYGTDADLRLTMIVKEYAKQEGRIFKCEQTCDGIASSVAAMKQVQTTTSRSLAVQDVQLADLSLRVDIVDVKTANGVLVWKIGDVARRRREAQSGKTPSLYSAPFYTSPCGYKMCARIYLDGDGMGKSKCISVFFVMMKGEYDALLPWPFQLRVTMMLMDQSESSMVKRNLTEVFRPDSRSASFKRPTSEMNTGSGCPMFAPVSVLESPNYVRDDILFIKVLVDKTSVSFVSPDAERM